MLSVTNVCVFVLAVSFVGIDSQVTSQHDQCIDQAFTRFHQAMTSKFPQYENVTVALPSSRHLFQALLLQNFTADALRDYCRTYETARKEYDQCSDSTYKKSVLSGFGLADYICLKRLGDYATGLPCLARADRTASDNCRGKCTQFEQASYTYLHPTESQNGTDMTTYMAGDCQYLKCWTDCRFPYLQNQCDNKTALLEVDSLIAAYTTLHDLYEPEGGSPASSGQHVPTFPNECRPFVSPKAAGAGQKDDVFTTRDSNGSPITQTKLSATTPSAHGGADRTLPGIFVSIAALWSVTLVLAK